MTHPKRGLCKPPSQQILEQILLEPFPYDGLRYILSPLFTASRKIVSFQDALSHRPRVWKAPKNKAVSGGWMNTWLRSH